MIRNIVFDMGNVILKFDPDYFMTREGVLKEEDRKILRNELFRSAEWALMDLGSLTEDTAEPLFLARIPKRLHSIATNMLRHWAEPKETIPGMPELVQRLKKAGYNIYLLSNASVAQHDYWPQLQVSGLFDGTLISCDVNIVKPSPEIYHIFLNKFGLKPEECVFIDDSAANVAGAIICGWQGIVFHGEAEEAENKLRKLGVQFS